MSKLRHTFLKYVERDGKQFAWTYKDEMMDLLDKLENYSAQYGMYSGPIDLVRELRSVVRRCDITKTEED